MADSRRELIFQNIKTVIQGIRISGDYEHNIDSDSVHIIHGKRDDSAYSMPLIYIYPSSERLIPELGEKGKDYFELLIDIEAWIRGSKSEMNTNINKMLADLKKALAVDHTRGGYAIDTLFISNDVFLADLTSDKCAVLLTVQINYETLYENPYSN